MCKTIEGNLIKQKCIATDTLQVCRTPYLLQILFEICSNLFHLKISRKKKLNLSISFFSNFIALIVTVLCT